MKQVIGTILLFLTCGAPALFAQPTINGTANPAEYQLSVNNQNPASNNQFGPQSDIGAIRTWTNGTDFYIGVPCKVEANGNQLAIWMGFSQVPGRAAGTRLSCAHSTGTYLDSTWTHNNYRADFEVDYMLSVRTDNGQVFIAKTVGANTGAQLLGTASTMPTNNTGGSILPAGAATFALNNQTGDDIRTTNTGFEIRFTLSALGATAAGNVRLFAIISGANDPFFSNVIVPGIAGSSNLGFDPNLASPPSGFNGPFNTGTIALPVELTSFSAQAKNDGVRLTWTTASEQNNAGFEVQRRIENRETHSEAWQVLGFVRGHGTTSQAQSYSFLDRTASGKVQYRLKQIDFDGTFEHSNVIEIEVGMPKTFGLEQNYPNPFNPSTTIAYQLPVASDVSLKVYDVLGREVATLVNARQEAGRYQIPFNASNLASGIYLYRLQAGGFAQTMKMKILK